MSACHSPFIKPRETQTVSSVQKKPYLLLSPVLLLISWSSCRNKDWLSYYFTIAAYKPNYLASLCCKVSMT